MYDFAYEKPGSLADAVKTLSADMDAKALAGGQTFIPVLKQRLNRPSTVVDLAKLGLTGITIPEIYGGMELDLVEGGAVVGGDVVDQPAGEGDIRAAQVLLGDLLAERFEDDRRSGREDRRMRAHHGKVGHRRHQRAMAGGGAEDSRDQRHSSRATRLGQKVGR